MSSQIKILRIEVRRTLGLYPYTFLFFFFCGKHTPEVCPNTLDTRCILSGWPNDLSSSLCVLLKKGSCGGRVLPLVHYLLHYSHNGTSQRLRWSRGSVLAFGTQVRGSKPGRSRRIFQGEKILSTPSFGREVKPFVPCRIFAACKRTRKCMRGSRSFRSKLPVISRPSISSFHY